VSDSKIIIVETKETIFFSRQQEWLRQWIMVTVENRGDRPLAGTATIAAGGEEATTALEIAPGVREYRCYAPALWPHHPPVADAVLCLAVGKSVVTATTSVGNHRPWTVYLLSDVCTDYSWVYADEEAFRADDAALVEAELAVADARQGEQEADRNHYNFVHAREAEFYLERYPHQAEKLFNAIRRGTITFNPFFTMCLTCDLSLEELIRHFYPARAWAKQHGLDLGYANHQETPTIAWAAASVLAGSGIGHLVKAILPYECPWAKRLEEPPIFAWEGPDGSRILMRRRNIDYVEGNFVLRDLRATNTALHDQIIPGYEALGERYAFDAIALLGCYGDLAPKSRDLPARKAATIAEYNAQGWEYPKLVNASHQQFWDDVEAQIAARRLQVPAYRGDYGASWDAWPSSLAHDFAAWRRAQERAGTADKLAAILSCLDDTWYQAHRRQLAQGWMNLIYLSDHAWNGANDANRALNARLRRQWQTEAHRVFDAVIGDGLAALGRLIPTGQDRRVLVFNGLGWSRTGVARLAGVGPGSRVVDIASEQAMPAQAVQEDGQPVLYFEAGDVPSVGYRVFAVEAGEQPESQAWKAEGNRLEGPFYAVEVSPVTGGIVSLVDKTRGVELVDATSPYLLNQCLYLSDGVEHTPQAASVEIGPCGPVFGRLIVRAALKSITLMTTITLYANLDRIDIRNELEKEPTAEKQEVDFAFPFGVPDRHYRFEAPGAIVTPGDEQRPGAGQAVTAVRHFVDTFNDQFGVTLSQADSGLVEFGHRTTGEDPLEPDPSNSTVLALALQNAFDWHEAVRDQAGITHFVFRYSLRGHAGGFDPAAAVRFGGEDNNELLTVPLPAGQAGDLPGDAHSFVQVTPDNAVLAGFKVAEEDGLIARLWECAGRDTTASVSLAGLGRIQEARQTDLLERDKESLTVAQGGVAVQLRARGLAAARFAL
jgi:alpha-mannosidase